MAAINYDAIAKELKRGLVGAEEHIAKLGIIDKPMALKEFYTLGMSGPRQTGKTRWIVENLIRDPQSLLVVLNRTQRDVADRHVRLYANCDGRDKLVWYPGGLVVVPDDLVELIRQDPDVVYKAIQRIVTVPELLTRVLDPESAPINHTQVFIDGRVQAFHALRYSKYYTWLAKKSDNYVLTWLID